jgi:hypothetical protein
VAETYRFTTCLYGIVSNCSTGVGVCLCVYIYIYRLLLLHGTWIILNKKGSFASLFPATNSVECK